ncbi:hypothetical protein [Blastopirellula marina]|uniref:Uncharacterized protein n=1 Tax=Blastopirellula marina DSM 3645 TaxID=314230 RepID=A3ZUH5_9BACT|nr:hypothetical protein [Blastopirellula marina]EAQ79885.1 hypothetical protein DSM3645_22134 [Blastopirellula marina DSM 3645]
MLVSGRTKGRLHGNSFRISRRAGQWYLITWAPTVYLLPLDAALTEICLECLKADRNPISEVPAALVDRYQLQELPIEQYDEL